MEQVLKFKISACFLLVVVLTDKSLLSGNGSQVFVEGKGIKRMVRWNGREEVEIKVWKCCSEMSGGISSFWLSKIKIEYFFLN